MVGERRGRRRSEPVGPASRRRSDVRDAWRRRRSSDRCAEESAARAGYRRRPGARTSQEPEDVQRQRRCGRAPSAPATRHLGPSGVPARASETSARPRRPARRNVNLGRTSIFGVVATAALLRFRWLGCLTARTRRGVRAAFRCCRCATSSSSRTWWCRCSSAAKSRSARSRRRWARAATKEIFLAAQRKAKTNEPMPEDIFTIGTIGTIIQLLRLPDGTVKVLVEGKRRARDPALHADRRRSSCVEVEEIADVRRDVASSSTR